MNQKPSERVRSDRSAGAKMMAAPPKHWQDWCIWLLGIWLCLSPWILPFGLDPTATQATVISGLLIIVAEVVTLSAFRAWEEWISVILGIWLIISPWAMGIGVSVARVNLVVVGLLVIALAIYEFWQARAQ